MHVVRAAQSIIERHVFLSQARGGDRDWLHFCAASDAVFEAADTTGTAELLGHFLEHRCWFCPEAPLFTAQHSRRCPGAAALAQPQRRRSRSPRLVGPGSRTAGTNPRAQGLNPRNLP